MLRLKEMVDTVRQNREVYSLGFWTGWLAVCATKLIIDLIVEFVKC